MNSFWRLKRALDAIPVQPSLPFKSAMRTGPHQIDRAKFHDETGGFSQVARDKDIITNYLNAPQRGFRMRVGGWKGTGHLEIMTPDRAWSHLSGRFRSDASVAGIKRVHLTGRVDPSDQPV
jgi:hypothetical protein